MKKRAHGGAETGRGINRILNQWVAPGTLGCALCGTGRRGVQDRRTGHPFRPPQNLPAMVAQTPLRADLAARPARHAVDRLALLSDGGASPRSGYRAAPLIGAPRSASPTGQAVTGQAVMLAGPGADAAFSAGLGR